VSAFEVYVCEGAEVLSLFRCPRQGSCKDPLRYTTQAFALKAVDVEQRVHVNIYTPKIYTGQLAALPHTVLEQENPRAGANIRRTLMLFRALRPCTRGRFIDHFAEMDEERGGFISVDQFYKHIRWPRSKLT
jgi:hypothetical protein